MRNARHFVQSLFCVILTRLRCCSEKYLKTLSHPLLCVYRQITVWLPCFSLSNTNWDTTIQICYTLTFSLFEWQNMIKKTAKLVWLLWLDQITTVRLLINMCMSMCSQIYHCLVKFCKQNPVIVTQINAIRSFAWGWKRSPRIFCSCSIWSCKVIALTKAKQLGLKVNSVWAVLHASLDLFACEISPKFNVTTP